MSSQLQVTGEAKIRDIQGPVVANSGVVTALDGAASQYVRGDGTLADFPTSSGGGSSVSYYLNSSVSQGTIGGVAYRELSKDPIIGAGTDIAISSNGYVANYITDVNDPDVTIVPGGNFNCEFYFSVSNDTGNPTTYAELYKYDGTTFTLLGTSAGVPESINQGTIIAPYYFAIPVATASLALTDRLAIRIYVNVDGRTVTLHTENSHLCQVVTTLSKGMVSLNNLTDQSQFLTTGTAGTNFAIASSGDTHTFNLPVASATNTGKLSSTDWTTFNNKIAGSGTINNIPKFTASGTIGDSSLSDDSGTLRYQGIGFRGLDIKSTNNSTSIRLESYSASTNADKGIKEIEMDGYYSSFNSYFGYNSSGAEWLMTGYADTAGNTTNRGTTTWQIPSLDGTYGYFDVRSYHSATPIIRAFASNNVVIGGSTNNSFKLEVVGTTKISGVLTLGSTISNGTNTYTLPSITGTLALLEGTQTFSGNKTFSALTAFTFANGTRMDYGLYLSKGAVPSAFTSLTTNIYSDATTNNIVIRDNSSIAKLDFNNSTQTYTFPAASGTIALTSDLGGYVTLATTQTISGAKTFTSNLTIAKADTLNVLTLSSTNTNVISFITSSVQKGEISVNASNFQFNSSTTNGYIFKNSAANNVLAITDAGVTTLIGALSGTSATFSGIVSSIASSGSTSFRVINADNSRAWSLIPSTNAAESDLWLYYGGTSAGTKVSFVNNGNVLIGSTTDNGSRLQVTGAATFSSNVGIGTSTFPTSTNRLLFLNAPSGSAAQMLFGEAGTSYAYLAAYGGSAELFTTAAIPLIFGTNTTERMRISSGGDILIRGTFNPYTATNRGNITLNGTANNIIAFTNNSTAKGYIFHDNTNLEILNASGAILLYSAATERMRITSGGDVGIGNTGFADVKLCVSGKDTSTSNYIFIAKDSASTNHFLVRNDGLSTFRSLAGTGSRAVLADAGGNLSAPVSDISVKQNISTIGYGLNEILKMNPVWFDFIDEYKNYGEGRQNGNIAQEMEEIIPEAVFTTPSTGKMGINYDQLHAVYIKAIQEQQTQIEELKALIAAK